MLRIWPLEKERYKQAATRALRKSLGKKTAPQSVNLADEPLFQSDYLPNLNVLLNGIGEYPFYYLIENDKRILRLQVEDDNYDIIGAIVRGMRNMGLRCSAVNGKNGQRIFSVNHARQVFADSQVVRFVISTYSGLNDTVRIQLERIHWDETNSLKLAQNNRWVSKIWAQSDKRLAPSRPTDLRSLLPEPTTDDPQFDVDYVFSWVNADDPSWRALYAKYKPHVNTDANSASRYIARDDLLYALRALEKNAPWVRNVYVLTNCAPPKWLNLEQQGIVWVDHSEVFAAESLPTFSSHAIETVVHKIPGLSEHYIYSNDDFFLARPTGKGDFFFSNGVAKTRLEAYGMVNGQPQSGQPDYLNGARNAAALLSEDFGVSATRLHTHSPQSVRKSVMEEMENRYPEAFHRTRNNRFRSIDDVAVTAFLYAHYAYLTGKAVPVGTPTRLIQQNHDYGKIFQSLQNAAALGESTRFLSFCINDGNDSHLNRDWNVARDKFLEGFFPNPSRFER